MARMIDDNIKRQLSKRMDFGIAYRDGHDRERTPFAIGSNPHSDIA